jgi:hypothetical protein
MTTMLRVSRRDRESLASDKRKVTFTNVLSIQ